MLPLQQLDSRGKGQVTLGSSALLPSRGEIASQTQGLVLPGGGQQGGGQPAPVQMELQVKLSTPSP
jgi:hypothetical protein